jgi:hypothetical protein
MGWAGGAGQAQQPFVGAAAGLPLELAADARTAIASRPTVKAASTAAANAPLRALGPSRGRAAIASLDAPAEPVDTGACDRARIIWLRFCGERFRFVRHDERGGKRSDEAMVSLKIL